MELQSKSENIIALYKDNVLVAIVKQNGKIEHFKCEPMLFSDYEQLYEADRMSHARIQNLIDTDDRNL